MRRKLAAGNWKMNGTAADLAEVEDICKAHKGAGVDILICPPATLLSRLTDAAGDVIATGGQDCHAKDSGAHTGDIAAGMLADAGATYVILGHSERREDHEETDQDVREKAKAALAAGLKVHARDIKARGHLCLDQPALCIQQARVLRGRDTKGNLKIIRRDQLCQPLVRRDQAPLDDRGFA